MAGDTRENAPTCAVTVCLACPTCHRLFHGIPIWNRQLLLGECSTKWEQSCISTHRIWLQECFKGGSGPCQALNSAEKTLRDDRVAAFDPTGPYLTNEIVLKGTGISGEHLPMSWKGPGVDVCSWWVARFLTVSHLVTSTFAWWVARTCWLWNASNISKILKSCWHLFAKTWQTWQSQLVEDVNSRCESWVGHGQLIMLDSLRLSELWILWFLFHLISGNSRDVKSLVALGLQEFCHCFLGFGWIWFQKLTRQFSGYAN